MHIAVLGLGYVGCVSMACLVRDGHHVIGVDIQPEKIESIRQGKSPVIEPGLQSLIQSGVAAGRIEATDKVAYAIDHSEIVMVCVGTPSRDNGGLEFKYVERVCRDIGRALASKTAYTTIVVRSTVLPGSSEERLIPLLESESGKEAGVDFGFCMNPEFLREGSAIADFDQPPFTLIGQLDEQSGEQVSQLHIHIDAPLHRVPLRVAEMTKYASNAFHALKVVFANEIGNLCQALGTDGYEVMEILVQDTKLNLSPSYLKPGFAFGGSCLSKDLRALLYAARQCDACLPVLESILPSNRLQVQKAIDMLLCEGRHKIGIIGLSFKQDTDDLRESPAIELAENLLGKGFELCIYDREVSLGRLHGSNRAYVDRVIPHIGSLMRTSLEETVGPAEAVVVTKRLSDDEQELLFHLLRPDQVLVDLVRLDGQKVRNFGGQYRGIGW
jgi:GDP-mannose 6-dehydrogenase